MLPSEHLKSSSNIDQKLYTVEQEKLKKNWDLEIRIQNYFNSIFNISKAVLISRDVKNNLKQNNYNEKKISKKEEKMEFEDELKKLLKDPELYLEINNKLKA